MVVKLLDFVEVDSGVMFLIVGTMVSNSVPQYSQYS